MHRTWLMVPGGLLCLLVVASGCGQRTPASTDGAITQDGAVADSFAGRDGLVRPDASTSACTKLVQAAQVVLEYSDTMKTAPALAFDGARFALVWHSQPAFVSSLNGELRFALVDAAGKASAANGVSLGSDNGVLQPALVASSKEYAVLHLATGSGAAAAVLQRVDTLGKGLGTIALAGTITHAALAPHPSGYLAMTATPGSPQLVIIDTKGPTTTLSTAFPTAQVMETLWLAPRSGGFAAALHSTNSNVTLYLLDQQLAQIGLASPKHGTQVVSAGFAALPTGFATIYKMSYSMVQLELLDSTGKSLGYSELGDGGAAADYSNKVAVVWSGRRLIAGYSTAVPSLLKLRVLDTKGGKVGAEFQPTNCVGAASTITMAWGKDRLAVASLNHASGVQKSCVCVTLLRCQ